MVTCEHGDKQRFRVYQPQANSVELVGSFSNWKAEPIPMLREPSGWWTAEVALKAGDHLFNYLVDGSVWLADYAASGVKANGYGGWVSQLHVGAPAGQRALRLAA